jgi:predicted nucleotidyltransferase
MSTNRDMVRRVAVALAGVGTPVVFVGGAAVELLVTDKAAPAPRPTDDVDVVIEAATYAAYAKLGQNLRDRGFREDTREGAPTCRWIVDGVTVDVMPAPFDLLGFNNRWAPSAFALASDHDLGDGVRIRVPSAPVLLAMKLEALASGTRGDLRESRDLEDVVALLDGRPTLVDEVLHAPAELQDFLRERAMVLLADPSITEVLAGHLPGDSASQGRVPLLLARLRRIVGPEGGQGPS